MTPFSRKRFGQHFLEPAWVTKVVRAIDPQPTDVFLEIGPGRGALTRPLAERARRVIAYEIDRDLAAELRAGLPNVTVVEGDFLEANPTASLPNPAVPVRIAGNLPYNVSSPILFRLQELYVGGLAMADATLMVQREVADRLVARPGTGEYGVLSVLLQRTATIERLVSLPPGAFRPRPNVHSTLVRLRFHPPAPAARHEPTFVALVRAVFTRRRKTLANALLAFGGSRRIHPRAALEAAVIDPRRRPETLSAAELVHLADVFFSAG
jgi:16S rRNA (adenine1518-N6/adenine1519-N6)-dimethyltransferase